MNPARALTHARRRAGLTQRVLAARTGVSQPTIARIERGLEMPRVDTLERLLRSCGDTIEVGPRLGEGVDRSGIRALLAMTPAERAATLVAEADTVDRVTHARRVR